MCIRDSITAGFHWNSRDTRKMFCNSATLFPHYVTICGKSLVRSFSLLFSILLAGHYCSTFRTIFSSVGLEGTLILILSEAPETGVLLTPDVVRSPHSSSGRTVSTGRLAFGCRRYETFLTNNTTVNHKIVTRNKLRKLRVSRTL